MDLIIKSYNGDSLNSLFQLKDEIDYLMILKFIIEIGTAIHSLHSLNICHRNINFDNIVYSQEKDMFILNVDDKSCHKICKEYYYNIRLNNKFRDFYMDEKDKMTNINYCYLTDIHSFIILIEYLSLKVKDYNDFLDEKIYNLIYNYKLLLYYNSMEDLSYIINKDFLAKVVENTTSLLE